jgi:prepilin-type N-terminal cleavage/methylation domain-containing protein
LSGTASSERLNESGFTLIEAVVAIALLTVAGGDRIGSRGIAKGHPED